MIGTLTFPGASGDPGFPGLGLLPQMRRQPVADNDGGDGAVDDGLQLHALAHHIEVKARRDAGDVDQLVQADPVLPPPAA